MLKTSPDPFKSIKPCFIFYTYKLLKNQEENDDEEEEEEA